MSNTETLVDTYVAMWNEADPQQRRELVAMRAITGFLEPAG
jgi:hypothetical protein